MEVKTPFLRQSLTETLNGFTSTDDVDPRLGGETDHRVRDARDDRPDLSSGSLRTRTSPP